MPASSCTRRESYVTVGISEPALGREFSHEQAIILIVKPSLFSDL